MLRRLSLALSLAVLLAAAYRPQIAHAHAQMFTVSVGRDGFESLVDFTLVVEAGHQVTLTFTYADSDLADDNRHDIKIKGAGLKLPTVTVSRDNPTATITFVPEKSGTLRILCVVPCVGMENLVGGLIKVVKPRATGSPTSLTLDLSPRDDGDILARATLQHAGGRPLAEKVVNFILRTSLGGELLLGSPTTMEDGSAVLRIPAQAGKTIQISAQFEGGDGLAFSEAVDEIAAPGQPMVHEVGGLSTPAPPPVLALVLLIVLGGVWATYGFVVYQVIRIRR